MHVANHRAGLRGGECVKRAALGVVHAVGVAAPEHAGYRCACFVQRIDEGAEDGLGRADAQLALGVEQDIAICDGQGTHRQGML